MNNKFDVQNLNFIKKSGIVTFSDDLLNDIINYGHTYVIEGDLPLAKSIYSLLDLNYTNEKYEMSVTATCARAEKLFNDMQKDGKGNAELRVIVG